MKLLSTTDIVERTGATMAELNYILMRDGIKPVRRVGRIRLYHERQLDAIIAGLPKRCHERRAMVSLTEVGEVR